MQPTEGMIDAVIAAGGSLAVERAYGSTDIDTLVRSAIRFRKFPAGRLLLVERGEDWSTRALRLLDLPQDLVERRYLAVPATLRNPEPPISELITATVDRVLGVRCERHQCAS